MYVLNSTSKESFKTLRNMKFSKFLFLAAFLLLVVIALEVNAQCDPKRCIQRCRQEKGLPNGRCVDKNTCKCSRGSFRRTRDIALDEAFNYPDNFAIDFDES
uniref:Secreted protein n=1 Tax=Lutzomyia longipalpis TaxID=7200 RepID=A0A1B0GHK7_LUTLO